MQKKIIALAVAGLVSGAVFAQSTVTMYGLMDMNYTYLNDNYVSNTKNFSAINSGSLQGSRLGFKGSEDLGDGLSVIFDIQMGIWLDTGTSSQGGLLAGRQSIVGLNSTTWGQVKGGRLSNTFHDDLTGDVSPMDNNGTIARMHAVYNPQGRYDNAVAYYSPVYSGFSYKLGYASQASDSQGGAAGNQDVVPTAIVGNGQGNVADTNLRVYTGAVKYANGPLYLGASYEYNKLQDRNNSTGSTGFDHGGVWNLGAYYNFGPVKVSGAYGVVDYAQNLRLTVPETKDNRKQYMLGLSAPVGGNGLAALLYAHGKTKFNTAIADDVSSMWGAAYFYYLSKRTTFYTAYADVNNDDNGAVSGVTDALGAVGGGKYQRGFQVGIRHVF
jgi:predicted porin